MTMQLPQLQERLADHWWVFLLRGIFAIVFGVLAFVVPGITIVALLALFAAYMLVDGVAAIVAAVRAMRTHGSFWPLIFEGVVDLAAGAIAVLWPGITLVTLLYVISAWAIVSGIFLLVGALRFNHAVPSRWLLVLNGVFSIIWGVLLFLWPITGLLVLTWWVGAYALIFGIMLIAAAVRLRRDRGHPYGTPSIANP